MIRMTVREGGTVRTVRLEGVRVEIGSAPSASLRLGGAGVAPRHCVLRGLRGGLEVLDQASREGTILNGVRVSRAAVRAGDTLTVGSAAVVIEEVVAGPAPGARVFGAPATPTPTPTPAPGSGSGSESKPATTPSPGSGSGSPPAPAPTPVPRSPPAVPVLVPRAAGAGSPDSALSRDSFEMQLYRAVRHSPPLLASVGLHAAAALLAFLLVPAAPAAPPVHRVVVISSDFTLPPEEDIRDSSSPEDMPRDTLSPPNLDLDRPPAEDAAPLRPPPPPSSTLERTDPIPLDAISVGGPRKKPVEKPVDFGENPAFHGFGADDANRSAAGLALDSLGGSGSGDRNLLKKLDPRRVLVVKGCYDHIEDTLALLGVHHDTLAPAEVSIAPLPAGAVLIVDCDSDPWDEKSVKAVQHFVATGGYLCTTDWGLENVVERAFPGMVRSLSHGATGVSTQNEVVGMRIVSPGHPLVRGIRAVSEDAAWWVEDQAHPMEVLDPTRVTVLAESAEFKKRYRSGVLAVTFTWGKGKVLHLLGHAWQKEGNLKGTFAIQRMLLNFLLARAASGGE